jgi:TolA-binding protein
MALSPIAIRFNGRAAVEPEFELARLFPENETFASQDLARVQVELNLARERLGSLPEELEEMRQRAIELNGKNHQLTKQLREQKERIQKLRSAYLLMRKRKQKGLSQPAVSTSTVADLPRPNQVSSDSTESNLPETTPTQLVPPQRPTPSLEQPAESDSGNVLPT